jgi:hypothetical protein
MNLIPLSVPVILTVAFFSCHSVYLVSWTALCTIKETSVGYAIILNDFPSLLTVNYFVKLACAGVNHC